MSCGVWQCMSTECRQLDSNDMISPCSTLTVAEHVDPINYGHIFGMSQMND